MGYIGFGYNDNSRNKTITSSLASKTIIRKVANMEKEMCRINDGKMAEGVCGSFAKYFGIDVSIGASSGCCSAWQAASEFCFILSALLQCLKNEIKKYHQRARRTDAEPMNL